MLVRLTAITALLCFLSLGIYFFGLSLINKKHHSYHVTQTEDGFKPSYIVVQKGSTITFSNQRDTFFWPASDIHPSHSIYSDFDPRRGLEPEEEWSFTFTKEGVWRFHDHLVPTFTGEIYVTKRDGTFTSDICNGNINEKECWVSFLDSEMREKGLKATFEALSVLYQENNKFPLTCHLLTHDIGLKAYKLYKQDVPLIPETGFCNAGFYHGYMEGFFSEYYDPKVADTFCQQVGSALSQTYPNAENQCRHGIGHGSMESVLFQRPYLWGDANALVHEGISICEAANNTADQKMRCISGVFSSFSDWAILDTSFSQYVKPEKLFELCPLQEKEYAKEGCYWGMAKRFFFIDEAQSDEKRSMELLLRNLPKEARYAELAIESLSTRIGRIGIRGHLDELISICRLPKDTSLQERCIFGMVQSILFAGEPLKEEGRALVFCESPLLTENERTGCYSKIQNRMATYSPKKLEQVCSLIPRVYQDEPVCVK